MIEDVIAEENITCDSRRSGKLKLALKPSHVDGLKANFDLIHKEVDPDTRWLAKSELSTEIVSDDFHGGCSIPNQLRCI